MCDPGGIELVHLQGHSAHSGCTNTGAGLDVHRLHRLELGDAPVEGSRQDVALCFDIFGLQIFGAAASKDHG